MGVLNDQGDILICGKLTTPNQRYSPKSTLSYFAFTLCTTIKSQFANYPTLKPLRLLLELALTGSLLPLRCAWPQWLSYNSCQTSQPWILIFMFATKQFLHSIVSSNKSLYQVGYTECIFFYKLPRFHMHIEDLLSH